MLLHLNICVLPQSRSCLFSQLLTFSDLRDLIFLFAFCFCISVSTPNLYCVNLHIYQLIIFHLSFFFIISPFFDLGSSLASGLHTAANAKTFITCSVVDQSCYIADIIAEIHCTAFVMLIKPDWFSRSHRNICGELVNVFPPSFLQACASPLLWGQPVPVCRP